MSGNLITTYAAATILQLKSDRQVRNLIESGRLKASKFGAVWLVNETSVLNEKKRRDEKLRKNGRKKK